MTVPVLKPTNVQNENFAGVTYHVQGELVPVLHIELGNAPVFFEHHVLLWKEPAVDIGMKAVSGAFKRAIAGLPILMTVARGPGRIGFSRDGAGHVFGIHLNKGEAIEVREHQFLAATDNLEYGFSRVKGIANMMFGGSGFFIDTFACKDAAGVVWLHGYGNVFEIELKAGESIDVEPSAWIYKQPSVRMDTNIQRLTAGLFGASGQLVVNRFTGPGRLGIQSMSLYMPQSK
ncbi:MAG TPA: AIM24 family protein [Gammaproteobacteria bacterium]|nr:AIM24 family protein [Gammaproteobacteria bacterium]